LTILFLFSLIFQFNIFHSLPGGMSIHILVTRVNACWRSGKVGADDKCTKTCDGNFPFALFDLYQPILRASP
jgi:hypothetical protein